MHKCALTDDELRAAIANHDSLVAMAGQPETFRNHTSQMASALRELLDRRAAAESESSLAYEYAAQLIDGHCGLVSDDKDELAIWFDMYNVDEMAGDGVAQAFAYLDSRGLIHRHPAHRSLIQICDEDAAVPPPQPQLVTEAQE